MSYISGSIRTQVAKPKVLTPTVPAQPKNTTPIHSGLSTYQALFIPTQVIVSGLAYDVSEHLCTGGVGEVYLAVDSSTQRAVVIKAPRAESFLPFLEAESRELMALRGTGIAPEIRGFDPKTGHLVADYIKGKTLRAILEEKGRLSVPEAIEITMSICYGLEIAIKKEYEYMPI